MVIEIFYDTLIRSLDETPKIMRKFFKMLKIGYGEALLQKTILFLFVNA